MMNWTQNRDRCQMLAPIYSRLKMTQVKISKVLRILPTITEFDQLSMEDQLKFKIAASFLVQPQNREATSLLEILERSRNENADNNLWKSLMICKLTLSQISVIDKFVWIHLPKLQKYLLNGQTSLHRFRSLWVYLSTSFSFTVHWFIKWIRKTNKILSWLVYAVKLRIEDHKRKCQKL